MKTRAECCCHDHEMEFDWEEGDGYVTIGFWTRARNWMGIWDRIKKAWQVFWWGSAMIDDVQISSPEEAMEAASLLMEYAQAEGAKRADYEKDCPVAYLEALEAKGLLGERGRELLEAKRTGVPSPVAAGIRKALAEETRPDPVRLLSSYVSQGVQRKPLPKE